MSTRLMLLRIPKGEEFQYAYLMRTERLKDISPEKKAENRKDANYMEFLHENKSEVEIDLQLFDISESYYYCRILESGHFLWNFLSKMLPNDIVFWDDRANSEEELIELNKPNGLPAEFLKALPDLIDSQIEQKRYYIIPVIEIQDFYT